MEKEFPTAVPSKQRIFMSVSEILSGAIGGVACVAVGQPFDTIKTKRQTFPNEYRSNVEAIRRTFTDVGIRGFYAGSIPAVMTATGENAILFFTYNKCILYLQSSFGIKKESDLRPWHHGIAGSMSGIFTALVVCPTELVKCRRQVEEQLSKRNGRFSNVNIRNVVRTIYRQDGARGYFRGLTATWCRDILGYFTMFTSNFAMEQSLDKAKVPVSRPLKVILSGGFGGCCLWMVAFPLDVLKSRIQVKESPHSSLYRTFLYVMKRGGLRALYKGLTPAMLRSFPANGALWLAYDTSKHFFDELYQ
jgi:solute carrier family 25 ornithine transporter 2/15